MTVSPMKIVQQNLIEFQKIEYNLLFTYWLILIVTLALN